MVSLQELLTVTPEQVPWSIRLKFGSGGPDKRDYAAIIVKTNCFELPSDRRAPEPEVKKTDLARSDLSFSSFFFCSFSSPSQFGLLSGPTRQIKHRFIIILTLSFEVEYVTINVTD